MGNFGGTRTNNQTRLGVIRKDFTISGKIGDSDSDKDIGYLGTVRQIEDGLKRGYSDTEVIAAVIKTITPKILRNYISMVNNLTIPKLFNILRLHYKEQSATELYQSLVQMKQEKKKKMPPLSLCVRLKQGRKYYSRRGAKNPYLTITKQSNLYVSLPSNLV